MHRVQGRRDKAQVLKEQGAKVGLNINATKKKPMRISTKRGDGVPIEGEQVEKVDEFTYLGNIYCK